MHPQTRIPTAPAAKHPLWAAALLVTLAACGGSDDTPTYTNGALSSSEVSAAQAAVEPAASAADVGTAPLTAAQIVAQQNTAVERATITDTATIDEKQAALDLGEGLTPAF